MVGFPSDQRKLQNPSCHDKHADSLFDLFSGFRLEAAQADDPSHGLPRLGGHRSACTPP
jgi:hypothetical protein